MRRRDEQFPDNGFEAWGGYMQAKIAKLEEQFSSGAQNEGKLSDIFNGVSIFVNGFTIPSAEELKELMAKHGGVYHTYQRSEDFLIASNLPDTKVKNMSLVKVVKPEWITDCIAAEQLLDYKDYLLYRHSKSQGVLKFEKKFKNEVVNKSEYKCPEFDNITKTLQCSDANLTNQNNKKEIYPNPSDPSSTSGSKSDNQTVKTANDPNFITEFYNNSRLHHISQLGACFKQHVNDLRETGNFKYPARVDLKNRILRSKDINKSMSQINFSNGKTIMHIDMDCFFVSVGLRKRPELRGKPVAVTHSKGGQSRAKRSGVDREIEFNLYKQKQVKKICKATGITENDIEIETRVDNIADEDDKFGSMSEIASCSYEARAKGISNGMFMGAALRLCPNLATIPYDFDGYKEVAYTLYNTIAQYTLDIEAVSCDEMYVDCTGLLQEINVSVDDFATALREEIKYKTGCPCSTGFGGNRLQARLATKKAKPDGQFFLTSDLIEDFMFNIKLSDLPGVGRQTAQKLESLGHTTCGSLQNLSLFNLQQQLGNKTGEQLYNQCRGCDPNPLTYHTIRKSVSAEVNYGIRFENQIQCEDFLKQLSAEVSSRMSQFKVIGKCVTLKLMIRAKEAPVETAKFMGHGFCDVVNKSINLPTATSDVNIITRETISLCKKLNVSPVEMRGVGIQVTKLESIHTKPGIGSINKFLKPKNAVISENVKHQRFDNVQHIFESRTVSTTPIKEKIRRIDKKSPIIGTVKSPTGKKRGRPSKSKIHASTQNLMNKFLQGQRQKETSKEVYIKEEVRQKEKTEETKLNVTEKVVKNYGLLALPWDKVRGLLRAWFDSGQTPKQCDVDLISQYMREMVADKNIDKLNILLNFMRRRIHELHNEMWNEVQDNIMEEIQNAMLAVYGKKLWISEEY